MPERLCGGPGGDTLLLMLRRILRSLTSRSVSTESIAGAMLIVTLLTACVAARPQRFYDGAPKPLGEVAVVRSHGATLKEVNGQRVDGDTSEVHVSPGPNVVRLSLNASNFNARDPEDRRLYRLDLDAKAGTTYIVTGRRGEARWCAFPVIPGTGRPDFYNPAACVVRE